MTNAAKRRVLFALDDASPNPLTPPQIATITGMNYFNVSRLLNRYYKAHSHYIRRLKKKGANGAYRYSITPKGKRYLKEYTSRIKLGMSLGLPRNWSRKSGVRNPTKIQYMKTYTGHKNVRVKTDEDLILTPEQLAPYVRLTHEGAEKMGIKYEDRLRIVGIIKSDEDKKKVRELRESIRNGGKGKEAVKVKRKVGRPRKNPLEPKTQKDKAKSSTMQEAPVKQPVSKQKKSVGKPAKQPTTRKSKETEKVKRYVVLDLDSDELEYEEKVYTTSEGATYTSRKAAKQFVTGLNDIEQRMRFTLDKNNIKKLQNEKRDILVFLRKSPDVLQFIIQQ